MAPESCTEYSLGNLYLTLSLPLILRNARDRGTKGAVNQLLVLYRNVLLPCPAAASGCFVGRPASHPSITQRMKSAITWWRLLSFVAAAAAEPESCAPMKIAVLGATGGVGKHVVRLALEAGHSVTAIAREPSNIIPSQHPNLHNSKFDMQTRAVDDLADVIRGCDLVLSCLGNRRGEPPVVANGTAMLMAAMAKSAVPRMAMISSIGIGDSWLQLYRLGFGGWIFSAIFATILRSTKNDLTAAETLAIGGPAGLVYGRATPHSRPDGVSVIVVRPAGLSDAPGEGKYDISLANGSVGSSVARGRRQIHADVGEREQVRQWRGIG